MTKTTTPSESVCQEAERLVGGPRQQHYGPPTENFQRIADLWNAYLGQDLVSEITVQDVCAMMILLKQARMRTGRAYHRDSAVDTCGYAYLQEVLDRAETQACCGPGEACSRPFCTGTPLPEES